MSQQPSAVSRELSPEVAKAQQCDDAGQHTEAINHLVAGVRKNDVEAYTRLGKRLLVGDRAPLLTNDGLGFLVDASKRGGAEAAALLSVLFGIGLSPRHGLAAAFDSLVLAAERGWPQAQAQIALLAGAPGAASEPGPAGSWRQLAKAIDLAAWQTPLPGTDLNDAPLIRSFPDFLGPAACRWLIERARPLLSRALVYEALAKQTMVHPTRTNNAATFNVLNADFVCLLMQRRMCACLGLPFSQLEAAVVLHYAEGREITEHFDFVDPKAPNYEQEIAEKGQRIVTFLVYLNDDYAGGETEFTRLGITRKGRTGEGLFFSNALEDGSSDVRTLHAGRPTTQGEKWIVSQFVRNRPVLGFGTLHAG